MDRLNEGRMRWRGQEWNDVEKRRGMEKIVRMKRKSDTKFDEKRVIVVKKDGLVERTERWIDVRMDGWREVE